MKTEKRRAAAALVVLVCLGGTACGTESGGDATASPASAPDGWKPWQTSFVGGERDDHADTKVPTDEDHNGCRPLVGTTYADGHDAAVDAARDAKDAKPDDLLRCSGTKYRDEVVDVRDGSHHPKKQLHHDEADFAHEDGVVLTHARPGKDAAADDADDEQEPYLRTVYAVDAETREEVWSQETQSWAVYSEGSVIGDERTKVTWEPGEDREDGTPDLEPGGDLVSWNAGTGEEEWRIETPEDEWCQVAELDGDVFVTCEDDQSFAKTSTWYRVDTEKERLDELTETSGGGEHSADLTDAQDGDLILTPDAKGRGQGTNKRYDRLIRLDVETGKEREVRLPKKIQDGSTAIVRGKDVYFQQQDERREWVAVDGTTGKERWTRKLPFKHPSKPTVNTERGEVYFTDEAGRLVAYDRTNGDKLWETDEPRAEDGGTKPGQFEATGSVAVVDDVIVVSAGNTTFSLSPDDPEAEPEHTREVSLGG